MTMVIEPADDVLWTAVDGEVVLLTMGDKAQYHGLRGSAVRIWELIDQRCHDAEAIVGTLLAEHAGRVAEAVVREDVAATLAGLTARGLIRTRDAG